MVQVLPAVKVPLVGFFQESRRHTRPDRASVLLPHIDILLMHDGIVRKQGNGRGQGGNKRIVFLLVTAESRWQLYLPSHADVPALGKDNSVPAIHDGEIGTNIYRFHTLLLTRMNLGSLMLPKKRERPFSPKRCCTSSSPI